MSYDRRNYRDKWRIERDTATLRGRLGLDQIDVIDGYAVIRHLGAELYTISDLAPDEIALHRLRNIGFDGLATKHPELDAPIIILNCGKPPRRQMATLFEELAHLLLAHRPSRLELVPELGIRKRTYDESQEHEAYDYGSSLLLPKHRVQRDVKDLQLTAREIADAHGCSSQLVEYRIRRMLLWRRYKSYAVAA